MLSSSAFSIGRRLTARSMFAAAFLVGALVFGALLVTAHADAQTAMSLSSVKKVFIASFGPEKQDDFLRQVLAEHLKKSGAYQVVDTAQDADAVLKGDGQIWVKGHFTINSRAPAANRQPVYAGFLSAEVAGRDGVPLWSYLVTPSRFSWSNVADDLAGNLTDEMVRAKKNAVTANAPSGANQSLAQADLAGAGATFPAPLYRLWFQSFQQEHAGVHVSYASVGSELGVQRLTEGGLDFAASDVPPQQMSTPGVQNARFQRIATVLGGVVPVYHLEGLTKDLNFTPAVLADIYMGKITRWNDAEIRKANKDVDLPDAPIVVMHRSDGSGTTHAWSEFLSKTSPEWKTRVGTGTRLKWPAGQGAEGSEGIAIAVLNIPNAIGYVEFVYAIQHELSFGAVQNSAGHFVRANIRSLAEAANTASNGATNTVPESIVNSPGKTAYPISSFTWILLPEQNADPAKKKALAELIRWMLTSGQEECSALGYAPLPEGVASQELDELAHSR